MVLYHIFHSTFWNRINENINIYIFQHNLRIHLHTSFHKYYVNILFHTFICKDYNFDENRYLYISDYRVNSFNILYHNIHYETLIQTKFYSLYNPHICWYIYDHKIIFIHIFIYIFWKNLLTFDFLNLYILLELNDHNMFWLILFLYKL